MKKQIKITESFEKIPLSPNDFIDFRGFFAKKTPIIDRAISINVEICLVKRKSIFWETRYLGQIVRELVDCGFIRETDISEVKIKFNLSPNDSAIIVIEDISFKKSPALAGLN